MELPEDYIAGSSMQYRDTKHLIEEFKNELMQMHGKCLDIGCGPGQVTKEILLPLLPDDAEVIGVDISQEMVNYARKKFADKRLSYIVLDIESPNLPKDQIECYHNIVSFYCIHWCNDMWFTFKNIYKLLQPEGKALVMFLAYNIGFEAYIRLKPRFQPYLEDAHRYVPYFQRVRCKNMRASLQEILQNVGFKILHVSNREKSFEYSKTDLQNSAHAINPFVKRFPNEKMKKDFLEQLINEVMSFQDAHITLKNKNNQQDIILTYNLLVAYVQKPPAVA
ncbi:juvenile hormone acid methyltransferase isoform X1 [Anoplolepis gracilipes]|uniref:juvenile hormone acid methyltransferase isoform X1 n=1 Tax=Anoplolepis gracilipes TaxID=354296 RepID=UPI003BA1AD09